MTVDAQKLDTFVGKMVGEMGAAMSAALILIGDKLGLYKGLAEGGAQTSAALAARTKTHERYVREWLAAQAASGWVEYDAARDTYALTPEQIMVFADDHSPAFFPGFVELIASMYRDEPRITEAFKSGHGVGWHEHDACLFRGTERFFRPGYAAHLVQSWLPALDGVVAKLERGAKVADVGCGHGASTIIMAKAFPKSEFFGFDYHAPSIEAAKKAAEIAGLSGRIHFEVAHAKNHPARNYDLVTFFDCLHDMGDPAGASAHVKSTLDRDGTWMLVEPFAHNALKDNLNPVGRIFYSASTMICTPASKAQEVGLALGAQAGEARLAAVVKQGGFTRFRRATETPFNLILEARH